MLDPAGEACFADAKCSPGWRRDEWTWPLTMRCSDNAPGYPIRAPSRKGGVECEQCFDPAATTSLPGTSPFSSEMASDALRANSSGIRRITRVGWALPTTMARVLPVVVGNAHPTRLLAMTRCHFVFHAAGPPHLSTPPDRKSFASRHGSRALPAHPRLIIDCLRTLTNHIAPCFASLAGAWKNSLPGS